MQGLTVKIIGTLGFTPWKSRLAKKFTSCRLSWNGKTVQIDIGNKYEGKPVDHLLISHLHYDHIQEFRTCPRETEVLVPSGTFIERLRKDNPWPPIRLIKMKTSLDGLAVRPFPVLHSSTTLTYGFKFFWKDKKIVWLSDYMIVPMFSEVFNGLDILFLGASALKRPIKHRGYGHGQAPVYQTLSKIARLKNPPKKIYLIHFGMGMGPIEVKTHYLQREFPKLSIDFTKDGKTIRI